MDDNTSNPDEPEWDEDMNSHVLRVNRYDRSDILLDRQYFFVVVDRSADDRYISSATERSTESEPDVFWTTD